MKQLKLNVLANFFSKGWSALIVFIFVPIYIRFVGIEAYGLVGLFTTLQVIFSLLDLGLSTTLNREVARLSTQHEKSQEVRDLVRTMELIYWAITCVITVIVFCSSPLIARDWVQSEGLSDQVVQQAVLMLGLTIAFEFPFALYSGGLLGLQKQVALSGLQITAVTMRNVGAALVLQFISPSIQAFFIWQMFATFIQTTASGVLLWRALPMARHAPRFQIDILRNARGFAAGMIGISILATILTQIDKIVLSKLLTLEQFGYYTLAGVVASGLYLFINPIFNAVFPLFSQIVTVGDEPRLRGLYHQICQLMSVVLLPTASIIALFAPEVLMIWTGSDSAVEQAHGIVSLLIIGTMLNGLMNIPYALQLAYGWTKLAFYQNLVAVILLVPFLFWATSRYGAIGAALAWVILNTGYILVGIQVMHTRLIKGEKLRWYYQDVGLPLLATLSASLLGRWLFPIQSPRMMTLIYLVILAIFVFAIAALSTPFTYNQTIKLFSLKRISRGSSI